MGGGSRIQLSKLALEYSVKNELLLPILGKRTTGSFHQAHFRQAHFHRQLIPRAQRSQVFYYRYYRSIYNQLIDAGSWILEPEIYGVIPDYDFKINPLSGSYSNRRITVKNQDESRYDYKSTGDRGVTAEWLSESRQHTQQFDVSEFQHCPPQSKNTAVIVLFGEHRGTFGMTKRVPKDPNTPSEVVTTVDGKKQVLRVRTSHLEELVQGHKRA